MSNSIQFKKDLVSLINFHSIDNDLNVPDELLADVCISNMELFSKNLHSPRVTKRYYNFEKMNE